MVIVLVWLLIWALAAQGLVNFRNYHEEYLPRFLSLENNSSENVLLPFNTTRTPGSKESLEIQNFIKNFYVGLESPWKLEEDSFESNGLEFNNLVYTLGENSSSYVVLSAHYDSKVEPEGFIGASDSAASCAILLYVSRFLDTYYQSGNPLLSDEKIGDVGFKMVFFDGEEALKEWSAEDSLYGSRHLANKWVEHGLIDKIHLFVLLDLLGSEPAPIRSYFRETHEAYERLASLESMLFTSSPQLDSMDHSILQLNGPSIDDDHIPFYRAGVPVLHLIPWPFPSFWHTLQDDFDHLQQKEIDKWAILLSEFLIEESSGFADRL
ncbi:hypothetical protein ZYGR_0AV00380 [Zygosaccharomyces rouxii]|uniref:Peptide hydrolase n=1 Tax=Zygosaccharomyces rouxii TaxID=4956 RepID=A0A1Q3AI50_ZYGRO|nr:hypothetical protein ZYGR_0AV00380 [Zygosaccharomyces rouxii]